MLGDKLPFVQGHPLFSCSPGLLLANGVAFSQTPSLIYREHGGETFASGFQRRARTSWFRPNKERITPKRNIFSTHSEREAMLEERLAGAGAIKASAQQSGKCCPYKIQALGTSGNKVCSEKHPRARCVTAAPSLGSHLPPRQAANAAGHVGGPGLSAFKAQAPWHGLQQRTCPWQTQPPHRPWGQGVFWDTQSGFRSTPVHFQPQRLDPKASMAAGFKGKKRDNDDVIPAEFAPALRAFFFLLFL